MSLSSRRLGAWIALAAIGFHALWPLLAHAGPRSDPGLAEVCSATGAKHAAEAAPGQGPASHADGAHCLLCPLSGDRNAPMSGACHAAWLVLSPATAGPLPETAALASRAAATTAHPRAPPARS